MSSLVVLHPFQGALPTQVGLPCEAEIIRRRIASAAHWRRRRRRILLLRLLFGRHPRRRARPGPAPGLLPRPARGPQAG